MCEPPERCSAHGGFEPEEHQIGGLLKQCSNRRVANPSSSQYRTELLPGSLSEAGAPERAMTPRDGHHRLVGGARLG
jgi:hypothetical protein